MQHTDHRTLTDAEITALKAGGSHSDDWKLVSVHESFDPSRVRNCRFQGHVRIGKLTGDLVSSDGVPRASSLSGASFHNVVVGDGCVISNVGGWLSNLDIQDHVLIENVGTVSCAGETTFGSGHEIAVLNEGGGRELKITRKTSAQIAYLTVLYRDRKDLVARLNAMAQDAAAAMKSKRAPVGARSRIVNSAQILNVWIGPGAIIEGVLALKNGTIDSSLDAPVTVADGVVADNFIFQKGASVTGGAVISSSLIGEGARIGKNFSSENSALFANSEGFHSEVCSIFAGPYTVSHHRSTLLIAGLFSFYNAGSGTNQSNHMYKLGPLHQGVLERGCKTGSFSYLLWPCRIGAFTAVIGKHYANFDTSDLPFSYIAEEDGKSTAVPAMNFFTVGTMRDGEKWPARDRRKHADKLDLIVFDVLSPYTARKMIRGRKILTDLAANADRTQTYVTHNGIRIKRLLLKTCARYYTLAIDKYFGDTVMRRIEQSGSSGLAARLAPDPAGASGPDEWVDLSGLICRKSRVETLVQDIVSGRLADMDALQAALRKIYDSYRADEWNWVLSEYTALTGANLAADPAALRTLLGNWKESSLKLLNMVMGDASKEFEGAVRLGFGLDANADADFEAVRGTYEGNKFVKTLKESVHTINKRYESAIGLIK